MSLSIVITGGHGFVGQHLRAELAQRRPDANLIIWDRPDVDITDPASYRQSLNEVQPAWVIHLAAMSSVGQSFKDPELVNRVNVIATRDLLSTIAQESPSTRVLAASSSEIYGSAARTVAGTPLPELALADARPLNPYAMSKLEMEKIIETEFNDRVIRVRPFPHIGPGQQRGFVTADFASQVAAIESGAQPPVIKVGRLTTERDFTDVRDVVRAYDLLLDQGVLGEVYHVASGRAVAIQKILDQLLALASVPITVAESAEQLRPSEITSLAGDARKLHEATGWEPRIPLSVSLTDILNYWREERRYA